MKREAAFFAAGLLLGAAGGWWLAKPRWVPGTVEGNPSGQRPFTKLQVEGGWIYRSEDQPGICFVPAPPEVKK